MAKQLNSVELKSEGENNMTESSQSGPKAGSKNRASRAGTRSVASLTPEQLARKRANDREAQRSIRLRTKTHIAYLEQRIRELSGDRDDRVIEAVCRRNLELEEELRYLRHLSESLGRPENGNTSESMMVQDKNNLMYLPSITSVSPRVSSLPIPTEEAQSGLALWDEYQHQMAYVPHWNSRIPSNEETEVLTPYYGSGNTEELMPSYSNSTLESHRLSHHTSVNGQDGSVESLSNHAPPAPIPIPSRTVPSFNAQSDPLRSRSFPQSGSSPVTIPHLSASGPQNDPNNNISFTSYPTDRKIIFNHSASNSAGNNSSFVNDNGSSLMVLESNYY
ncbi:putative bzip transcription [Erysiphe neolycopersici]|uniref:Putative bzip transcription n=1 Tax=Erysiphe neolycopersici TaxID=212602 RepID=A0A420I8E0_9PEZI|nr:putative bzip transcription [Erysiphe neolycopersici]